MSREDILSKVRQAEVLVIQALALMNEVKRDTLASDNPPWLKRRDVDEATRAIYQLYKLIEPNISKGDNEADLSITESDYIPRGAIGVIRSRYEIWCGIRRADGWKCPKVEKETA